MVGKPVGTMGDMMEYMYIYIDRARWCLRSSTKLGSAEQGQLLGKHGGEITIIIWVIDQQTYLEGNTWGGIVNNRRYHLKMLGNVCI